MEIWIKYLGDTKDNYTRYGKIIPHTQKKVDVCRYWGIDYYNKKKIEERVRSLEKDKKIKVIRHKGG